MMNLSPYRNQSLRNKQALKIFSSFFSDVDEQGDMNRCFQKYQKELDCRHDKHERLVKLSRDVTIESKRVIFLMQRNSG